MSKKKDAALEKEATEKIDVQAATLVGTIRDEILSLVKNHCDWKKMNENKQREIANVSENIAKSVVRKSANIIAGRGFKSVNGTIKQVVVKDGLKIIVEASGQTPHRHDLIDSQGGSVTMVLSDISPYLANRSEPEIDVDEPALPFDGGKKKKK